MNDVCSGFIRDFNAILRKALGGRVFYWGFLQINKNSISRPHVDKNNVGPSAIVLFGRFSGGAFRMCHSEAGVKKTGCTMIIDGTQMHFSEQFQGLRYSVIAFLHNSTRFLADDDKQWLLDHGFELPAECFEKPAVMERHGFVVTPSSGGPGFAAGVGSAAAVADTVGPCVTGEHDRLMIEFCCERDSILGRTADRDCQVWRLTEDVDMTRQESVQMVVRHLEQAQPYSVLLWASIPCTGGSQWNVHNLLRAPELLPKMQRHWRLFQSLWMSFESIAKECLENKQWVALEWPRDCTYWDDPQVRAFIRVWNLHSVEFDGCMLGVTQRLRSSHSETMASRHELIGAVGVVPQVQVHTPSERASEVWRFGHQAHGQLPTTDG
jgi:hypothetical protein